MIYLFIRLYYLKLFIYTVNVNAQSAYCSETLEFLSSYNNCDKLYNIVKTCFRLPLLNLPFPGKAPSMRITPSNSTFLEDLPPFCYIQQVTMRLAVMPWDDDMKMGDAFRAPLYEVFKVLEVIRNYQHENRYTRLLFFKTYDFYY